MRGYHDSELAICVYERDSQLKSEQI